jgi:thioredoxin 1
MSGVLVLHFWSPTCNPCKVIKPALEDIQEEFKDKVQWASINIKEDVKGIAAKLNISVVPTLVVMKNDIEIGRHSGTNIGIYYAIIRKALAA